MINIVTDPSKKIRYYFRVNSTPIPKTLEFEDENGNPYPVNTKTWQINLKNNERDSANVVQLTDGDGLVIGVNSITIQPTFDQFNVPAKEYYIEIRNVTDSQSWFSGKAIGHNGEFDNFESTSGVIVVNDSTQNSVLIDQTEASDYGALSGVVDGVNDTFTVSNGSYTTGTLMVYRNGVMQTAGEYVETSPSTGVFTFVTPPLDNGVITAVYGVNALNGVRVQPNNNYIFVNTKSDLPTAVAGLITLPENVKYHFTSPVDLTGDRLFCSQGTAIQGTFSLECVLSSTGLDPNTALITSNYSLNLRGISLDHGTIFDLDADGNPSQALVFSEINIANSPNVGVIKNYTNFIGNTCSLTNSANLVFDGTFDTIGIFSSLLSGVAGESTIIIPSTAVISRRFRVVYTAFIAAPTVTAIDVSSSASVPVEGYILDSCNFAGGGTYISGVPYTDVKALFFNNKGIENSSSISYYTMTGNATPTVVSIISIPVKVAGITTSQVITQKFTNTNNRATYTGVISKAFQVTAILTLTSGNNHQIGIYIAKDGTVLPETESHTTTNGAGRSESVTVHGILTLDNNQYIEIHVENDTAVSNITVIDMSVIIKSLN